MQSQRRLSRDATKNLGLKQSTENKKTIERVQKSAVAVILDSDYENSEHGLSVLALQCLHIRRKKLCTTFARRAAKHPQHSNWFQKDDAHMTIDTRSHSIQEEAI